MAHGANVTVNDILSEQLAADRLTQNGIDMSKINYVKADLTDADATDMLVHTARERFGPIHVALSHRYGDSETVAGIHSSRVG